MTDKEHASISFEEVWESLEEQDKTGVYRRAREMADLAKEQLEYAFNSGYKIAKAKYDRPQGKWEKYQNDLFRCSNCGQADEVPTAMGTPIYNFCPNCGAKMQKGSAE